MQIDLDDLRQHYASLSDDELLVIDPAELTEAAQRCYEEELARRGLAAEGESSGPDTESAEDDGGFDAGADTDWLADAACACSYVSYPGGSAAADADKALEILRAAGIPCEVSVTEVQPAAADPPPRDEYRVMVPGALNLKATSVLDKDLFNADLEAEWRTHFEALTDAELRAVNPEAICAGMADRIARLKRAYADEMARRKLKLS